MQAQATTTNRLEAGGAALARADWDEARALFAAAGDGAEALEGLSRALWWLGDEAATLAARERAYRAYRDAGDQRGAARMAMWLASDNLDFRGDDAVAEAWLRCGHAHADGLEPCDERGFLLLLECDIALLAHADPRSAERLAREALSLSVKLDGADVAVVGHALLGAALVARGAAEEGIGHLDQAAALAVAEDFGDVAAPGWALCHLVTFCTGVGDFGRAAQWCRALHAWSATWRARHFFGICRTAYGGVLTAHGDWPSAREELTSALEDLSRTRPALAASTAVRLGELRRREGDVAAARELFESALPLPDAIVALGELDLDAGDPRAAAEAAERVLRRLGPDAAVLDRFAALELLAAARAAAGDAAGASAAADEVERDATALATPYMRGRGRAVRAAVQLAAGDHDGARRAAEDAVDLFTASSAPYEAARSRELLAAALERLGRAAAAEAEARAARDALARLGARPATAPDSELSPREVDILRLVAEGCSDAAIAERLFLSPHTVHRHVANIRTKLRTPSRAAAVAEATKRGLL